MKGFTLIELLIVIAILAVLTTAVVLVLNPAQLLAEARDAQRMSDLDSVRSAIALYLATATTTTMGTGPWSTSGTACGFTAACVVRAIYAVDNTGWVEVNLNLSSGGSPLSVLPRDPVNGACTAGSGTATNCQYGYQANSTTKVFELNTVLESTKYGPKMGIDGGTTANFYEIGTTLAF